MRASTPRSSRLMFSACLLLASTGMAQAQAPPAREPGVVPDDRLTLVVGTRLVSSSEPGASARSLFTQARIPLSSFNETDHCIDQGALEVAQEYFNSLGRLLGKAGHYYFVPDANIKMIAAMCERMHGRPAAAWAELKTSIIAFGQVVPTADAPTLEKNIR